MFLFNSFLKNISLLDIELWVDIIFFLYLLFHCLLLIIVSDEISSTFLSLFSNLWCLFSYESFQDFFVTCFQQFAYDLSNYCFNCIYPDWSCLNFWNVLLFLMKARKISARIIIISCLSPLLWIVMQVPALWKLSLDQWIHFVWYWVQATLSTLDVFSAMNFLTYSLSFKL